MNGGGGFGGVVPRMRTRQMAKLKAALLVRGLTWQIFELVDGVGFSLGQAVVESIAAGGAGGSQLLDHIGMYAVAAVDAAAAVTGYWAATAPGG